MRGRKLFPDEHDKARAGERLHDVLFDGENTDDMGDWLQEYIEERAPGINRILAAARDGESAELPYADLPEALVAVFGTEIFEGDMGRKLRNKIFDRLLEAGDYKALLDMYLYMGPGATDATEEKIAFNRNRESRARVYAEHLKSKFMWRPGRARATEFVRLLRLPYIFAGIPSDPRPPRVEEVMPIPDLKELRGFQINMKLQVTAALKSPGERAIVTLPTGAGKTRIVAEAVVDILNERGTDRNMVWIAHSQEVCEQAVLCFKQIWEHRGKGSMLNILRMWGDHHMPTADERGIIIGSVQKLYKNRRELGNIVHEGPLTAVFIDEAHHSVADMYGEVLEGLGMSEQPDVQYPNNRRVPLIGLTATPMRADGSGTLRLKNMYRNNTIFPSGRFEPRADCGEPFDPQWQDLIYMRHKLANLGYLAEPDYHVIDLGRKVTLTEEETQYYESGDDRWMEGIATEEERNRSIRDCILEWAQKGKKILYFGTNVAQSNAMSHVLETEGIRSVCITAETRYAVRKQFVDAFNERDGSAIQVMCNYNVLSTGFDSPRVDTVVIARPTTSIVAYQQMMGRGLRGRKFGGNSSNHCSIVTVRDNIEKFDHRPVELAYSKV